MKNLIVTHNFDMSTNMVEVRKSIEEMVKKWDVVIQEDKLTEAKKLMADFNKQKNLFKESCKNFINEISDPITKFKEEQKEIETLFDDGRQRIKDQVDKFEAGKLEEIKVSITEYRDTTCHEKGINPESITCNDLIMLTAVTSSGQVAKKTKDTINQRIAVVENEILKAKLAAEEKAKHDREIAEKATREAEARAESKRISDLEAAERKRISDIEAAERRRVLEQQDAERRRIADVETAKRNALSEQGDVKKAQRPVREAPTHAPETANEKVVYEIKLTYKVRAIRGINCDALLEKVMPMINSGKIPLEDKECYEVYGE